MNDRIHELAKECYVVTGSVHTDHFAYWKFAELIVQECVGITKHHVMNISTYADADFVEKQIQEHFGIEE